MIKGNNSIQIHSGNPIKREKASEKDKKTPTKVSHGVIAYLQANSVSGDKLRPE